MAKKATVQRPRGKARLTNLAEDLPIAAREADAGLIKDPKKDGIPAFLQVQNRKPLSAEVQAKLDAETKKLREDAAKAKTLPFGKPKGMTLEEWEAYCSRQRQQEDAKKQERLASLPKKVKKELPKGSFTLRGMAKEEGIDPKDARRVARAHKAQLKVLEIAGKYVYDLKSRAQVLEIIKKGLADAAKKKEMAKKASAKKSKKRAKKLKLPAADSPEAAVFAGKAKVQRQQTIAPKPTSKKADDRKVIKAAMKGRKKIKVEGGAMYVKRLKKK